MKLTISETPPIRLLVRENTPIIVPISVKEVSSKGGMLPEYTGAVVVTPKVSEQVLRTKETSVMNDITVKSIPYTEVSNLTGITVNIGG